MEYYLKSKEYYEQLHDSSNIADIYHNIAMVFRDQKEYKKSIGYFKKAIKGKKQTGEEQGVAIGYNMMGNYKNALNDYRLYKKYWDSVFNIVNAKKIQALELNHQFNQEKLADSLQFAKEKSELELITEAESAKKQLYFILFLVTIAASIVIGYLIRRIYKNRERIAKEELEKNKSELVAYTRQLVEKSKEQEAGSINKPIGTTKGRCWRKRIHTEASKSTPIALLAIAIMA